MLKALREYKQFLNRQDNNFTLYEKKLAKLILDNFEQIENTSSHMGRRGNLLGELIINYDDSIGKPIFSDEILEIKTENQFNRISSLSVKNFRGFSNEQLFDLKKPYTFVYGPNGSGKTSFCEALEYGLLGTINEADVKRIKVSDYINNADTNKSDIPILKGFNNDGVEVILQPMPKDNEFCFIERNRIEGFARVSANSQRDQQQQLASLFGLEDFNKFVINFVEKIDRNLDCEGAFQKELSQKELRNELHNQVLQGITEKISIIENQKKELLNKSPEVNNLNELKEKISGSATEEGIIQKNKNAIAILSSKKKVSDPGIDNLIKDINDADFLIKKLFGKKESLNTYKDEISLKNLYTAILNNEKKFTDICPACESEIFSNEKLAVPINPYSNAKEKIREFEIAIKIENEIKELNKQIPKKLLLIESKFIELFHMATHIEYPQKSLINDLKSEILTIKEEEQELLKSISATEDHFRIINDFKDYLAIYNQEVSISNTKIEKLNKINEHLDDISKKILNIQLSEESTYESRATAEGAIHDFYKENEELIAKVKKEKNRVSSNRQYRDAYTSFRAKLFEYNNQLPSTLVSSLSEKTKEFYNSINKHDCSYDLLEDIKLPSGPGENIEIQFKDGRYLDALHVLSEGHLRCLGLSILLAKNVADFLPIIIFDDVVNAIDDEHRRGVIETIIENEHIKDKQLIITTHGEEFIKQLELSVSNKEYNKKVNRINFLKSDESKAIIVKLDLPKNYLILAQKKLENGEYRDSLANGRRFLEHLLNKLWRKLGNKYQIQLVITMRQPNRAPDLMSTAKALSAFIEEVAIDYEETNLYLKTLISSKKKYHTEWNYLNKGTHEEDRKEEFDKSIVKDIIHLLENMDNSMQKVPK